MEGGTVSVRAGHDPHPRVQLLLLLVAVVVVTAFPRLASYIHTLQVSRTDIKRLSHRNTHTHTHTHNATQRHKRVRA